MNNISFLSASNNIAGLRQSADIIDENLEPEGVVYFGFCKPGTAGTDSATWTICKMVQDLATNVTSFLWASGSASFNKVWDDRATYDYQFSNFRVV